MHEYVRSRLNDTEEERAVYLKPPISASLSAPGTIEGGASCDAPLAKPDSLRVGKKAASTWKSTNYPSRTATPAGGLSL